MCRLYSFPFILRYRNRFRVKFSIKYYFSTQKVHKNVRGLDEKSFRAADNMGEKKSKLFNP